MEGCEVASGCEVFGKGAPGSPNTPKTTTTQVHLTGRLVDFLPPPGKPAAAAAPRVVVVPLLPAHPLQPLLLQGVQPQALALLELLCRSVSVDIG
jgi:hypothetical protein